MQYENTQLFWKNGCDITQTADTRGHLLLHIFISLDGVTLHGGNNIWIPELDWEFAWKNFH